MPPPYPTKTRGLNGGGWCEEFAGHQRVGKRLRGPGRGVPGDIEREIGLDGRGLWQDPEAARGVGRGAPWRFGRFPPRAVDENHGGRIPLGAGSQREWSESPLAGEVDELRVLRLADRGERAAAAQPCPWYRDSCPTLAGTQASQQGPALCTEEPGGARRHSKDPSIPAGSPRRTCWSTSPPSSARILLPSTATHAAGTPLAESISPRS